MAPKSRNFLKWLSITTAYYVGLFALQYKTGIITTLILADASYLCMIILFVFIIASMMATVVSHKKLEFLGGLCTSLGLLGTIIGFAMSFASNNLMAINIQNQASIMALMQGVSVGMATALNTTIFGLVAAILLSLYTFLLEDNE